MRRIDFRSVILFSAFLRFFLIIYGEWQDTHMEVRYTDVDYLVFSDAAALVVSGVSPYKRSTYRYSPLIAYLLTPNSIFHRSWGKVLFSISGISYVLCFYNGFFESLSFLFILLYIWKSHILNRNGNTNKENWQKSFIWIYTGYKSMPFSFRVLLLFFWYIIHNRLFDNNENCVILVLKICLWDYSSGQFWSYKAFLIVYAYTL